MSEPSPITPKILGQLAQLRANLHDHDQKSRHHNYHNPTNGELFANLAKNWKTKGHKPFTIDCALFGVTPSSMRLKLVHGLNWLADNSQGTIKEYWDRLRGHIKFNVDGTKLTVKMRQDITQVLQYVVAADTSGLQDSLDRWIDSRPRVGERWPGGGEMALTEEAVQHFTQRMAELEALDFVGIVEPGELQFIKVAAGTIPKT